MTVGIGESTIKEKTAAKSKKYRTTTTTERKKETKMKTLNTTATKRYVVALYPESDKANRLHLVSKSAHKHSFKKVEEAEAFSASRHFTTGVYTIYTKGTTLRAVSEAFCDQFNRQ